MSGEVHHCPYCIVGGQYRAMIPKGQSKEYRCGGCGHTVVESDFRYLCLCSHCEAARADEEDRDRGQAPSVML